MEGDGEIVGKVGRKFICNYNYFVFFFVDCCFFNVLRYFRGGGRLGRVLGLFGSLVLVGEVLFFEIINCIIRVGFESVYSYKSRYLYG